MGLGFSVEEMTRVPVSDWKKLEPADLPDRLAGDIIGVDTETCDEGLGANAGAGWAWAGGGFVAGFSITSDNFSNYLPVAHADGDNMDPGIVRRWLNHVLK